MAWKAIFSKPQIVQKLSNKKNDVLKNTAIYWGVNFVQALLMWASDWCCSSYLHYLHTGPAIEGRKTYQNLIYLVYIDYVIK